MMELNRQERFSTKDLRTARSYLGEMFWPHVLRAIGGEREIDFRHDMVELGQNTTLNALRYGGEMVNEGSPSDDSYLVIFTLAGSIEIEGENYKMASNAGSVCVMNPNNQFRSHLSADHRQLTLKIDGHLVNECFENAYGYRPTKSVEFDACETIVKRQASGLGGMVNMLCSELNKNHSSLLKTPTCLHMEHILAGLVLEELPHDQKASIDSHSYSIVPGHIKIAREYIHSHARENISIQEVAERCEVTIRTLQMSFQKHFGVTPLQYLRTVRLETANRELRQAASQGLTITDVALSCGFSNSSSFANYYRSRYGCLPSAVLRGADRKIIST
jgi:AraC-like DNA-binding protein